MVAGHAGTARATIGALPGAASLQMILFLVVTGFAVVLGYLFGGRLSSFEGFSLRWWGLVILGLAIQFIPLPEGDGGTDLVVRTAGLAVSYTLLLLFAVANLRLPGMPLVLVGVAANFLVIGVNGGMPVSEAALVSSGQEDVVDMLLTDGSDKHHLMDDDDRLTFLADVIGVPKPIGQAISIGDVFVYAGLVWLTVSAMRGRIPSTPTERGPYRGRHRRGSARTTESPAEQSPVAVDRLAEATGSGSAP
jgi:hypothetical protein